MARSARPLDPATERPLLEAAATEFAVHGFDGASLNQILARAGWGKSSFYHYFRDKQQLHDRVVVHLATLLSQDIQVAPLVRHEPEEFWRRIEHLLDQLGTAAQRHPETRQLGLMYHHDLTAPTDGELDRLRASISAWVSQVVREGANRGVIRDDIPVDLATRLATTIITVLDQWSLEHKPHDPAVPTTREMITLLRSLLGHSQATDRHVHGPAIT